VQKAASTTRYGPLQAARSCARMTLARRKELEQELGSTIAEEAPLRGPLCGDCKTNWTCPEKVESTN